MKKWILLIVLLVVGVGATVGLIKKMQVSDENEGEASDLPYVELTICLIANKPDDIDMVLEAFNALTEKDLNCSVDIEWIGWGDFSTQYPIVLTTGEDVDLIYTANWLDFYEHAQRGAFAPLDDLLKEYAPESCVALTEVEREQATVNGKLYALPANYTNYNVLGVIARGDLMDKYQITAINSFEDYLNFCDVIAREEYMDPTGMCSMNMDMINMYVMSKGYYPITGSTSSPYWVDLSDEKYTVYFQSECPGIEEYLMQAQEWYQKGYWSSNVLASKDETLLDSGLAASRIHNYDAYLGECGIRLDWELQYYNLASPIVRQTVMQDAMAIPASSANKERAMMLLEKLRNDEQYYMLLTYGIEGYHYVKDGRKIEFLNRAYGNEPGTWGFRNEEFKCWDSALPENALELRKEYEENAVDTPLVNFDMDLNAIRDEYAAVKDVMSLYYDPLKLGYIDYTNGMEELNKQLETAGNEKVKLEIQRQIQEYMSAQ